MPKVADSPLWSLPVRLDEIPGDGRHFKMTASDAERAAIVRAAGNVKRIEDVHAHFELRRRGRDGLRVTGKVSAEVEQTCVVTLEPVVNRIEEAVDLTFLPESEIPKPDEAEDAPPQIDGPEPLLDGGVDLGAIATEFVLLGIDPYPRKEGAAFASPEVDSEDSGPFAALAALKKEP